MYLQWCIEENIPQAHRANCNTYYKIFNEFFNIKFRILKKDDCDNCFLWRFLPDAKKMEQKKMSTNNIFKTEKVLSYEFKADLKQLTKNNAHVHAAAFDFQKTLLCPQGTSAVLYYSMRLRNYDFTITNISNMEVDCFFWSEEEGAKGSNEVASCLLKYLSKVKSTGASEIHLLCDRCFGQNCNRMVFLCLFLAMHWFKFSELHLHFLVTGHSYNENDNCHSVIEKEASQSTVFTPEQWECIILNALTKKRRQVAITAMQHSDFHNFKFGPHLELFRNILKRKTTFTEGDKQEAVLWSQVMHLKFTQKEPTKMFFKYSYSQEEYHVAEFVGNETKSKLKKVTRRAAQNSHEAQLKTFVDNVSVEDLPLCYTSKLGITADKYSDLAKLCEKKIIPEHYWSFYDSLKTNGKDVYESTDEEAYNSDDNDIE